MASENGDNSNENLEFYTTFFKKITFANTFLFKITVMWNKTCVVQ